MNNLYYQINKIRALELVAEFKQLQIPVKCVYYSAYGIKVELDALLELINQGKFDYQLMWDDVDQCGQLDFYNQHVPVFYAHDNKMVLLPTRIR